MTPSEYLRMRNAYLYPAVGLAGSLESWRQVPFSSTCQMDCHHNELLVSHENVKTVLGYLSTIFWGHYSGQDRIVRSTWAEVMARVVLRGSHNRKSASVQVN